MRPSDRRRSRARIARLEALEPRELLSAMPAYDFWLDDHHLPATGLYADPNPAMADAHAATGLDQARAAYGFAGAGQTVAVIDTGIAYTHYALGGGYGPAYRVVGGWDFTKNTADAFDAGPYGSHGTHVAGIVGSDDSAHTGVAPEVDLVALRVFDDNGGGYFSWVEQALWWVHENQSAFENPITAVNLSLGTAYNSASIPSWAMLEGALAQLKADGIFVAVAAGNSFSQFNAPGLSYPAASPHVVPVGSVDASGMLSSFSQRHTRMIAAPGRAIMSTVPDYMGNYNGIHDDFARYSGTSMAAPYVAGASVLLREAYAFAGAGNVDQATLYNAMYSTADTFFDAATGQHYQRLNLQAALDAIMPADDYGSTAHTAHSMGTLTSSLSLAGHISRLDDADWFQFTAGSTGTTTVTINPNWNLVPQWHTQGFNATVGNGGNSISFNVVAGNTYRFGLTTADGLGHYQLHAGINGGAGARNPGSGTTAASQIGVHGAGVFYIDPYGNGHWGEGNLNFQFGNPGDTPIIGDWNGDGVDQIGVWRDGTFYLDSNGNGRWDPGVDRSIQFGGPDHRPIIGDWNGDGVSQIGVWRNGWFSLDMNGNGRWDAGVDQSFRFGSSDHTPIIGDFNGDGVSQIGVWRNGWFSLDMDGDGRWNSSVDQSIRFGRSDARPIIGDWNGDGVDQIGTWRNGWFSLHMKGDGQWDPSVDRSIRFGASDATPIIGAWSALGGQALQTAGLPSGTGAAATALSPTALAALADPAAPGLSVKHLQAFGQSRFAAADLIPKMFGTPRQDTLHLDAYAAGFGWFIDPTPGLDEEFEPAGSSGALLAVDSALAGRMDLLTVVSHELGHVLGLADLDPLAESLMGSTLQPGQRYRPGTAAHDAFFAALV